MRKTGADVFHVPIIEDMDRYVPSKGWAEMIRKVFEVDPLLCPQCDGEMKVISLFSFELAFLNVLHSFQDFSKQKLCIKSRILLHVKKGNSYKLRIPRGLGNKYYPAVTYT